MESLKEIGIRRECDKFYRHGYERFYEAVVEPFRESGIRLCEIGFDQGRSYLVWKDYFQAESDLHFIDIKSQAQKLPGAMLFHGDQGNMEFLESHSEKYSHFYDVIIDDGSHIPEHQIQTFQVFFDKCLKEGGTYIIEDIEVSYWTKDKSYWYDTRYGIDSPMNVVNYFSSIAHVINREFSKVVDVPEVYKQVATLTFCHNCIILKKMTRKDRKYTDREYKHEDKL